MLIDMHMHTGGGALGFDMKSQMILDIMDKYNVDIALVSNGDASECDHSQIVLPEHLQVTQEKALQDNIDFARANAGRIYLAVWVKPKMQGMTDELYNLMKDNLDIIKAIKLHPYHSATAPNEKSVIPYIEFAKENNLAVISHTDAGGKASPLHLYEVAKMFPTVPFVMAHLGLGSDNSEAIELLSKADNLFGDTAWVPMESTVKIINRFGPNRIMFGTDAPIDGIDTYKCNPKGERSMYMDYFKKLESIIGTSAYEDLMYKNAMDILGMGK